MSIDLKLYNQKMMEMSEHWDTFIMDRTLKQPNVWHDRIARGAYPLFSGIEQKVNIYRGSLPVQAGLSTWKAILKKSTLDGGTHQPTAGNDTCAPGTPHSYTYAWETRSYTGFQDEWMSEPICLNDMKFYDRAPEQLSLVVRSGVDYGVSILENWNREMYMKMASDAGRFIFLTDGVIGFEDNSAVKVTYNPMTNVVGAVPYIDLPVNTRISTLNWGLLDYLRVSMADRCGEAAIGKDSGMPVFGLMLDMLDFERFVLDDVKLRDDFRYAQPQSLIKGYDFGMKVYRGFALIHDARQARFRSSGISNGKIRFLRELPQRLGASLAIGNMPEPNPDYYKAELGTGVIFVNDVFANLFVPSLDNLGSGMKFGPAPGLTGEWKWINIPDPSTNMLGETGFFYGRIQVFPKPLLFSSEATVFLYQRCPYAKVTICENGPQADATRATSGALTANVDTTPGGGAGSLLMTVTLDKILDAAVGDQVAFFDVSRNATTTAYIVETADAPTYVLSLASSTWDAALSGDAAAGDTVTLV